ncbi:MAG: anti-sigma factor family protein [Nocardioidaceae bacterium]
MSDAFSHLDAAYVLGALPSDERRAFEAHLADCASCREAVGELAGMPGLLARVPLASVLSPADQDDQEPPASLLPALALEVRRRRRRTRSLSLAAAATVLAVAGAGAAVVATTGGQPAVSAGPSMHAVVPSPVHASARLDSVVWGTRIALTCTYDAGGYPSASNYQLVVVDHGGRTQRVATWTAVPGKVMHVVGATSWTRSDIARVEVRTHNGAPVLSLGI